MKIRLDKWTSEWTVPGNSVTALHRNLYSYVRWYGLQVFRCYVTAFLTYFKITSATSVWAHESTFRSRHRSIQVSDTCFMSSEKGILPWTDKLSKVFKLSRVKLAALRITLHTFRLECCEEAITLIVQSLKQYYPFHYHPIIYRQDPFLKHSNQPTYLCLPVDVPDEAKQQSNVQDELILLPHSRIRDIGEQARICCI